MFGKKNGHGQAESPSPPPPSPTSLGTPVAGTVKPSTSHNTLNSLESNNSTKPSFLTKNLVKTKTSRWVGRCLTPGQTGATAANPTTKYQRKLITALWRNEVSMSHVFTCISNSNLNLDTSLHAASKCFLLLLRIIQFGPPSISQQCAECGLVEWTDERMTSWAMMQAKAMWGEVNDENPDEDSDMYMTNNASNKTRNRRKSGGHPKAGYTDYSWSPEACLMVARVASLVSLKIRFHNKFSDFDSHYCNAAANCSATDGGAAAPLAAIPSMPRIFVVKAMTSLLDVGANADAVCIACFKVIEECLKFSDGLRMGELQSEASARMAGVDSEAVLALAIEASFALTPVLDESTLVYNVCQRLSEELDSARDSDAGGGVAMSAAMDEAVEGHRDRKDALESFKFKAGPPSKFVYGSASFVSSMYKNDIQEMWFTTPMRNVEDCQSALLQLEHGELYAVSKAGGNGSREFFDDDEFRSRFGAVRENAEGEWEVEDLTTPTKQKTSQRSPSFSDIVQQSGKKLEELLNEAGDDDVAAPSRLVKELSIKDVAPPSATKEPATRGRKTSSALQARLERHRGNNGKQEQHHQQQPPQQQQQQFDPFALDDPPPLPTIARQLPVGFDSAIEGETPPPRPAPKVAISLATPPSPAVSSPAISEASNLSPMPTTPSEPSAEVLQQRERDQQYHIRFQASNQPWRENMPDDVKELHELTCSDFTNSGICVRDFEDISDFKEIGAGAFACVYRANWKGRGVVAVKKLATQVGAPMTLKTIRDFRTEAALQRMLTHPNVVGLIAVCTLPLSLIMEFVPRGNLFALLGDSNVSLDWHQRLKIALGTVKGMAYLHAQTPIIVHRDLKSLNLLLTDDLDCKVTDFGLSRFKAESDERMTGQCGTYHWMAPEVINSEIYTEKADVYSVAIILWEIYTRAIPYDGMKPLQAAMHVIQGGRLQLPEGVPSWFKHLVTSCWDANPENRPSMKYVCDILGKAYRAVASKMAAKE